MAIRIEERVIDDLDGSTTDVSTCRFTIDDIDYEIDLSQANRHACTTPSPRSSPPHAGNQDQHRPAVPHNGCRVRPQRGDESPRGASAPVVGRASEHGPAHHAGVPAARSRRPFTTPST